MQRMWIVYMGSIFIVPHKYCLHKFSLEVLEDRICQLSAVH